MGGLYDIEMRVSVGDVAGMVHFDVDGTDVSTYTELPLSGLPGGWQTVTIEDVYLEEGPVGLTFRADEGGFEVSHFDISFTGTPALSSGHGFCKCQDLGFSVRPADVEQAPSIAASVGHEWVHLVCRWQPLDLAWLFCSRRSRSCDCV